MASGHREWGVVDTAPGTPAASSRRTSAAPRSTPCARPTCAACPCRARAGAPGGGEIGIHALDAKEWIWEALERVGGLTSSLGQILWHVLGEGRTLSEYVRHGESTMRAETASALLRGALEVLAAPKGR